MKISIVGTGYVGLVSGACLAEYGHDVICVDNNPLKVESINDRKAPIHEEGLDDLLAKNVGSRLHASTDLAASVLKTDITFIAVGTPFDGKRIDLQYIEAVSREIGAALKNKPDYHVVVVKSTVIPGTTDGIVLRKLEEASGKRVGEDIGLGMNPEFLTEGQAVEDFMNPDRIVVGGIDERSRERLAAVYSKFSGTDILFTNSKTAEMIKYASNALLATMISFSNEVAGLCTAIGDVDVVDVMKGVHASAYLTTRREGKEPVVAAISSFLGAGCGFGGSCLPKDVKALTAQGNEYGQPMSLLKGVIDVNLGQPAKMIELMKEYYPTLDDLRVAVLGLAFKPDTDDVRESPAFPIIRLLHSEGAAVRAYDPIATRNAVSELEGIPVDFVDNIGAAIEESDIIVVVTAWDEFRSLPDLLEQRDPAPLVVDGRRILDKDRIERYTGIGL